MYHEFTLQWGRTQLSAEMEVKKLFEEAGYTGFNGAALN